MMRFTRSCPIAMALALLAPAMRADTTLRYHNDIKATPALGIGLPLTQMLGGVQDMVIRIQGDKAYSTQGKLASILNLTTQELTLVDAGNKRFASLAAGQYAQQAKAAIPPVPAQVNELFASMKANLESRSTGRTEAIQGIQAEEREFVLTLDIPLPGGPATPAPFMKLVMQVWTAKPEEAQRIPALREFKTYMAAANSSMNPAAMVKQILGGLPGMGEKLSDMVDEMTQNGGMALRTHTEVVMPILALMSQQMGPGKGPAGPGLPQGLDPNAPLLQLNQELVELSTARLDEALFRVPADYQPASLEEILKGAIPEPPPAPPRFKQ